MSNPLKEEARLDPHVIELLEDGIDYTFGDKQLLVEAVCHSSFAKEHGISYNNERLEFFGDAVLEFIVSRALFRMHPDANEGELTQMRSDLVKSDSLFVKAEALSLQKIILHGRAMKDGELPKSVCADALEALLGAVCLDGGLSATEHVVKKLFLKGAEEQAVSGAEPKLRLQMWLQKRGMPLPNYELMKVTGPSHAPTFTVRLYLCGFEHTAEDKSRKGAEKQVAELVYNDLRAKFGE